jgi:hypothetical protein
VSESKLTFKDIENFTNEELANLNEKDYKHLGSLERQKVKIKIKTAKKPSVHAELTGKGNANVYGSVNESDSEGVDVAENENETETEGEKVDVKVSDLAKRIKNAKKKKKKPKFEETHTKDTIWIRNDIAEAIKEICTQRGEKTKFVNEALLEYLVKKEKELQ